MLTWIFLALIVYYAGVFLPSLFLIPQIGITTYLASRDGDPEPRTMHSRAGRATRNMQENLAPFLALAILAYVVPDADMGLAILGAQLFVLGRVAFFAALPVRGAVGPLDSIYGRDRRHDHDGRGADLIGVANMKTPGQIKTGRFGVDA